MFDHNLENDKFVKHLVQRRLDLVQTLKQLSVIRVYRGSYSDCDVIFLDVTDSFLWKRGEHAPVEVSTKTIKNNPERRSQTLRLRVVFGNLHSRKTRLLQKDPNKERQKPPFFCCSSFAPHFVTTRTLCGKNSK